MSVIKKFRIKSFKKQKAVISFQKVSITFGRRIVLDEINFNINQGEIFGMLGPNGVGKSTIFNLITGLVKPDSGKVIIENSDVTGLPISLRTTKFGIGYCPQYSGYFHNLSVLENLKAVGEILIKDEKDRKSKIDELTGDFELENTLDLKAKNLSGGQKARVVFTSLYIQNPNFIFFDEPTNNLDIESVNALIDAINNFIGGILIITHDIKLINKTNCQIYICKNKNIIKFDGTIDDYQNYLTN